MFSWFKPKPDYSKQLADILGQLGNREDLLGVKQPLIPTPDDIRKDAAKLYRYSQSGDYKRFADEVWSRVISDLDTIMDSKATQEQVSYCRGAVKRSLDILRLSYQARQVMDTLDQEKQATSRH